MRRPDLNLSEVDIMDLRRLLKEYAPYGEPERAHLKTREAVREFASHVDRILSRARLRTLKEVHTGRQSGVLDSGAQKESKPS